MHMVRFFVSGRWSLTVAAVSAIPRLCDLTLFAIPSLKGRLRGASSAHSLTIGSAAAPLEH